MATTTNYGWTTPDDTALVKDGASAIRSLGTAVDTTTKNLNPSTTLGDIEYRSSTANTNTRLGIGTTGQILTVAAGVPSWATPATAGGMTLIQETVANADSGIDFTSISGSYKQLLLIWCGIKHSTSGSSFPIRFNSDTGSNYKNSSTVNTEGVGIDNKVVSNTAICGENTLSTAPFGHYSDQVSTFLGTAQGSLLIDNYASTTKNKTYQTEFSFYNGTYNKSVLYFTGVYDSLTAITSINIVRSGGSATISNLSNSSIRLYGIS